MKVEHNQENIEKVVRAVVQSLDIDDLIDLAWEHFEDKYWEDETLFDDDWNFYFGEKYEI
jgi:hypothetical protein